MALISGFQCNCCGLIFDFPAYIGNDESTYVDIPFKSGTEEFLISDNQGAEEFLKILQEKRFIASLIQM